MSGTHGGSVVIKVTPFKCLAQLNNVGETWLNLDSIFGSKYYRANIQELKPKTQYHPEKEAEHFYL